MSSKTEGHVSHHNNKIAVDDNEALAEVAAALSYQRMMQLEETLHSSSSTVMFPTKMTAKRNSRKKLHWLVLAFVIMATAVGACMVSCSRTSSSSASAAAAATANHGKDKVEDNTLTKMELKESSGYSHSHGYLLMVPPSKKKKTSSFFLQQIVPKTLLQVFRLALHGDDDDDGKGGHHQAQKPPVGPQPFAFGAVFGDNMVLQHGSKAAIYGFLGHTCTGVQLDVYETITRTTTKMSFNDDENAKNHHQHHIVNDIHHVYSTNHTLINATQQPFGKGWGVRPCSKEDCPPYDMQPFNPWNEPLPTWKFLLPPQKPGGNFTIQATCLMNTKSDNDNGNTTASTSSSNGASQDLYLNARHTTDPPPVTNIISITNVTFGDMWYCSGQSNMLLPLLNSFHRNETAKNILYYNKYSNVRVMAGRSPHHPNGDHDWHPDKYGAKGGTNPWMTARQALKNDPHDDIQASPFFQFGAACWYFAQQLVDLGIDIPIGLANTAIGGQRIQEFMDNSTINICHNRTSSGKDNDQLYWEGELFGTQVLPFADMTVKGWLWYQGENNMFDVKGNSKDNIGYSCEMKTMIHQWRHLWSQTPGTTDPEAPFGIVILPSSGSEGGPDMGAMRYAQTANYGVLPHEGDLPNTFIAQAYDLDDEWGPDFGPCFENKCCEVNKNHYDPKVCTNETLRKVCNERPGGCTASMDTPSFMGGIHPRTKKEVGDRLGIAAFNLFYGGKDAYTGPTLQGCSMQSDHVLEIRFNKTLLRGDSLAEPIIPPPIIKPDRYHRPAGGSQLWVQTNASQFCMESSIIYDGAGTKKPRYFCPSWAGGSKEQAKSPVTKKYDDGWIQLNFTLAPGTTNAIHVDLSPLPDGAMPTAVRYAWDLVDCCDHTDPNLYVTHGCIANCPLKGVKSGLPANPFQAKIVDGKCECIAPQVCSDEDDDNIANLD